MRTGSSEASVPPVLSTRWICRSRFRGWRSDGNRHRMQAESKPREGRAATRLLPAPEVVVRAAARAFSLASRRHAAARVNPHHRARPQPVEEHEAQAPGPGAHIQDPVSTSQAEFIDKGVDQRFQRAQARGPLVELERHLVVLIVDLMGHSGLLHQPVPHPPQPKYNIRPPAPRDRQARRYGWSGPDQRPRRLRRECLPLDGAP